MEVIASCIWAVSTGAPQECVLSSLLFSFYTNNCTSGDPTVKLLKFSDDTTFIRLIQDCDESAYQGEFERLVQTKQAEAEHASDCRDDSGFCEETVETLGSTIS